ncbi:MAG: two-component system, chemotaxis family, response regulator CheB [Candidatus Electronema aureum]|uniref:protein-glutamate methylesterase n=1 Tax=Candidatus Electronema aureum TaxID=2005002 RepID=A0A521G3H4_9BACT|nr:MAG: two-component system, chemotaxis family, response regulator CheB [Candidatus Electronema aureum]
MKKNSIGNGFVGEIEGLGLVDIVQFACLSGDDRKLSVLSEDNLGVLYFSDNEIIHAEFGELTGEEAFYRIMTWPSGTFSMLFAKTNQRSIDASWNFLLLEAARRIDEQNRPAASTTAEEGDGLPKVLVVDDSRFFTKAFVKLFEDQIKAKVVGTATNGKEALKFLEMQVPDLVTLDMTMPVMSGDVALKHIMIRSPAPVVLVSNFNEQLAFKMMDFMRYGAVDVVAKPVNPESWKLISERLQYILMNVHEFCVDNVSRAKSPKPAEKKITLAAKPADRLLLILGGLGGLLELQKIIPALEYDETTAVMVLQNMYPGIAQHLASYFNAFTPYAVSCLDIGEDLLGGQCRMGNCHGKRQVVLRQGMPLISGREDEFNKMSLDADNLLHSAAEVFGAKLSVVLLSGVDVDLKIGMEAVVRKGGRIILQEPESCLLPGPLEGIKSLALEECRLKPEDIAPYLAGHIPEAPRG